ncbi:MAG: hypothetical protein AMJ78_03105 [Omnitrophica WOR_2 bacterium SM23_29]|nr:MAG: hypothetical protein AMJ78_03105 [Omnitrophica WOR_2 bacterium SM23_29]
MLIEVKCNLCGGNEFEVLKDVKISPLGGETKLVKCKRCELLYLNPRYDEEEERKYYASHYFEKDTFEIWGDERVDIFKHNLKMLRKYKENGKLLDLGCGVGQFLKVAKDNGWDALGLDISKRATEKARRIFNVEVVESSIEDANLKSDSFDVVIALNIIDQLSDPFGALKEIYRVLKKGGIVLIRVPNAKFQIFYYDILRIIGKICRIKVRLQKPPVFHNYMFSPKTAKAMLKKTGFGDMEILNSRLSIKNKIIENVVYFISEVIYYLTFKRYVTTPSMLVFAWKD